MNAKVGEMAPDFRLLNQETKHRSLSDYRGKKTALLFFPGAFTGVCTKEMCTFRDSMSKLNAAKSNVVGISVDSPFTLAQFRKENNLNFELLSDGNRETSRKYGVLDEKFVGIEGLSASKRSVFILDEKGKILHEWISQDPKVEPDYDDVLKRLNK
ncbi:MAG: peroxiredoxin [Candidatus Thermoplasmatota archaeon]|jgi:peroxiredoxin|nr:peroxiredoxin [Candidatus Thermoplasmatota archaeon]MCL5785640.1 peroxiredoxin [Candidatus Thermoplasmatota archaeon]